MTFLKQLLFSGFVFMGFVWPTMAAVNCDAELLTAMRTYFKTVEGGETYKAVEAAACGANSKDTTITVPYAGYSQSELNQACSSHDEKFFELHYKTVGISMLPDAAFNTINKICGEADGLSLSAHKVGDNIVSVRASWSGTNNIPYAYIDGLGWSPNIESCKGGLVDKRWWILSAKLGTGGLTAECNRKSGADGQGPVEFALKTDRGTELARVFGNHSYKFVAYFGSPVVKCDLNDKHLTDIDFFTGLESPPHQTILLNSSLQSGVNVLHCVETGVGVFQGQNCYKYKYVVLEDDQEFRRAEIYDCNQGTKPSPTQPDDIEIPGP
jgi:hypothetical protein